MLDTNELRYYQAFNERGPVITVMGMMIGILLYALQKQNIRKAEEERKKADDRRLSGSHQQTDIVSWCRNDGKESMEKDNRRIHEGKKKTKMKDTYMKK